MILCVAYYAPYFEWFGGAVSLSQWWDISHQFRHWMVFYISWCHLPKMGERTKQPVRSLHHIFHPKTQWQSPNPAQDPGEVLALGNTCSPCFSLLLSPEPWREKKTDAREKQGKDILPSLPAGTFPRSERLGQLEFARTFFHLSTKPHHKMLQFLFLVCLLVCSTFVFGKIILEAGTGDFNSCSSSRLGGWSIFALLLRKAGTKICWRLMRKRGCIVWTALSTRVHLCTHPCELLQLDSIEVVCKGMKKRKKKVNTSEMNCQRKVKQCVHAGWKQRLEKLSNEINGLQASIETVCSKTHTYLLCIWKSCIRDQDLTTKLFPQKQEHASIYKGCPQPPSSPKGAAPLSPQATKDAHHQHLVAHPATPCWEQPSSAPLSPLVVLFPYTLPSSTSCNPNTELFNGRHYCSQFKCWDRPCLWELLN